MLKSMTGFGKSTVNYQSKKVTVEIRSLNSKSMDVNIRISSRYRELDGPIRKMIANLLNRGKIDVSITQESAGGEESAALNKDLIKSYYTELKGINKEIGEESKDYLSIIMRLPEVFNNAKEELVNEEKEMVLNLVNDTVVKLNEFRNKEGKDLEVDFNERLEKIRELLESVKNFEQARIDTIKERMQKSLAEIQEGNYDENRLEQELIFYIEKLDISEEKMRLTNHLDYFGETMKTEQAGKKLGFITQEIGREINTLGSKSNHAEMQKLVIGMKDYLEKINTLGVR